ncbi:hypothetical protein [Nonomuraea sp. NPDC050310]|uniref:hypothetical protein n=1 Tax=Nonomuraea sp. NPDC050310 TaxID=3154935 RepID=UPI00340C0CDF
MISRGRWLGWGAFATAVALLLGCFAGWLWLERPPEQTLRSTATYRSEGQALTLDTSAGHGRVEIAAGRPGEIRVERTLAWDRARPQASQTWRDGVLSAARAPAWSRCPPAAPPTTASGCRRNWPYGRGSATAT